MVGWLKLFYERPNFFRTWCTWIQPAPLERPPASYASACAGTMVCGLIGAVEETEHPTRDTLPGFSGAESGLGGLDSVRASTGGVATRAAAFQGRGIRVLAGNRGDGSPSQQPDEDPRPPGEGGGRLTPLGVGTFELNP